MAIFDDVFTNVFLDGEVSGRSPDAEGDYYLINDKQYDNKYFTAKAWDIIKSISNDSTNDYEILFGGVVSDGGSGTIDLTECVARGTDVSGTKQFIHIPTLSGVSLPSGWNDDRQIWMIAKHDLKLGTETRTHRAGTSYHYQCIDTYLGDTDGYYGGSTDDLFVDADPAGTAVILGSFKMNGTSYTDMSVRSTEFSSRRFAGCDIETTTVTGSASKVPRSDAIETYMLSNVPVSTILMLGCIDTPSGWFLCDGSSISRTTYATLYNAITKDKGTFTVTIASPGVVTLNNHGLVTGDRVELTSTGALPTGLTTNQNYYVIYVDVNSFQLASTLAEAEAGTPINTSGTQSGIHSLRYVPFGINGVNNFMLPNYQGLSPKGAGDATINGRTKTGPVFGGVQEDAFQGHYHMGNGTNSPTGGSFMQMATSGGNNITNAVKVAITDGTNGTPRIESNTRDSSLGTKFYIKYE